MVWSRNSFMISAQIDGHGNFGSLDNDPAAAMRYTECRLRPLTSAMLLADLDSDTVDMTHNFDESQVRLRRTLLAASSCPRHLHWDSG